MATKPLKPAPAKKEAAPVAEAAAPKNNKKLVIVSLIAAVVLIVVGGALAWLLTRDQGSHEDTPKAAASREPKFIPLEAFTVNLQREEADQYLQINITLKVMEPELEDKIKAVLPEIRSKLNLLLSSKRPSELATIDGKKKLAVDIATETNNVLGIHNAAAPAAAPAGSAVAATETPGAESAVTPEPVAEVQPAVAGAEKKGVVDVLFTSFIIQ